MISVIPLFNIATCSLKIKENQNAKYIIAIIDILAESEELFNNL